MTVTDSNNQLTKPSPIMYAYEIDGKGGANTVSNEQIASLLKSDQLAWVHLDANHPDTPSWLAKNISYLDNIVIEALTTAETRPRLMEHKNGMLVILRGVNLNENAEIHDMISIRIWVDPHRIITLRRRKLKAVVDIREALEQNRGPHNAGEFIVSLSARMFQKMEPVIQELDDQTDALEEKILDNPDIKTRHDIVDIRKKAIVMRRYISPQKDVMSQMRISEMPWLEDIHKRRVQESLDRVTRYVEDLDAIRDRAQIVKDELASIMADRMNKNMYILSIVAAIFLPLGFLTGLLGINVGGMPGADNSMAFWFVCIICTTFMIVIGALFRFLKWV